MHPLPDVMQMTLPLSGPLSQIYNPGLLWTRERKTPDRSKLWDILPKPCTVLETVQVISNKCHSQEEPEGTWQLQPEWNPGIVKGQWDWAKKKKKKNSLD